MEYANKSSNNLYPVFLKAEQLEVLLVGGGNVGYEKARSILANSPNTSLTIIANKFLAELSAFVTSFPNVSLINKTFEKEDLSNKHLVILALNDIEKSREIKALANNENLLVNVADKPELCDFYLSSIVQKGNLKIAVSTNGKSPTIAKRIKEFLQENIPNEIDDSLNNLEHIRANLKGDFNEKVKQLNEITEVLVQNPKNKEVLKESTQNIIQLSAAFLSALVIAYFLFYFLPPQSINAWVFSTVSSMNEKVLYAILGGFVAQMIDGALGMAYGLTSTTILLGFGISPAAVSAGVHTSEIFTSGVSGLMHLRFGNVNSKLFKVIVIPGVIGAVLGSYAIYALEKYTAIIIPIISVYTAVLGLLIIIKAFRKNKKKKKFKKMIPLASFGGFMDALGGGGWGPIVSSTLIAGGRNAKYSIGSVNLAEFFVALASSATFITLIGIGHWQIILGLIIGGSVAAPIAARLSNKLPTKGIMLLVGIVVIIISIKRIFF